MPLKLPTFADPYLRRLLFGAHFPPGEFPAWMKGNVFLHGVYDGHGVSFVIQRGIFLEAERVYLRLWIDRVEDGPEGDTLKILETVAPVLGSELECWISADFAIPKDEMPTKGIVPALNVTSEIAGEKITVVGSRIIVNAPPIYGIQWHVKADELECGISGAKTAVFNEDALELAERELRNGLERYILAGQSGE